MNKTILMDVDLVLARSDKEWWGWLCHIWDILDETPPWELSKAEYNLTKYFKEDLREADMTGYEFWGKSDIYDNDKFDTSPPIGVVEGSIQGCTSLINMGYKVIPVSKVFPAHTKSKDDWIKRHFPMLSPAIYITMDGSKSDIKGDYIVEDRIENLQGFTSPTKGVILNTPYLDPCPGTPIPYTIEEDWKGIVEYFENEL